MHIYWKFNNSVCEKIRKNYVHTYNPVKRSKELASFLKVKNRHIQSKKVYGQVTNTTLSIKNCIK